MDPIETDADRENLGSIKLDQLQEGDLIFFQSEGRLQNLCSILGDSWVHVALAIREDGEWRTAEVGTPPAIVSRQVSDLFSKYKRVAVARPNLPGRCISESVAAVKAEVAEQVENNYPWDDVLTAAVILLTRRSFPKAHIEHLEAALAAVSSKYSELEDNSRSCSYFIYQLFAEADGPCALSVPVKPELKPAAHTELYAESVPALAVLDEMSDDQTSDLLAEFSLLQMALAGEDIGVPPRFDLQPAPMAVGDSRTSPVQFLHFIKTTSKLIANLVNLQATDRSSDLFGRWVTPTDLWHSPEIGMKAFLRPNSDEEAS